MNQALKRMSIVRDGWSKRGQKTYGDRNDKRGVRTSLIAGKRGKQLLASVLFKGSTNALWFNQWLDEHLIPELKPNSTLILDKGLARMYAAFHRKNDVFTIAEKAGHKVLFLPPYSPRHAKRGKRPFGRTRMRSGLLRRHWCFAPFWAFALFQSY